ncbi:MAG: tetratricopeptide repeat protein, partial [Burkholderiaceae bacterium]
MKLPVSLPISPKIAVIALGVLTVIVLNYEDLLFFVVDSDPAVPIATEKVATQPSDSQPPLVVRSALERLKDSAQAGNVKDQLKLAIKYSSGDGVTKDQAEASRWYLMAGRSGDVNAMYEVSMRYRHGHGFTKNNAE